VLQEAVPVKTFGLYEEGFLAACTINGGGTGGGSGGGGGSGSGVGTTWTLRNPGFGAFCSVTYGNGTFVVVGAAAPSSPPRTGWTGRRGPRGRANPSLAWPTATASSWRWGRAASSSPPPEPEIPTPLPRPIAHGRGGFICDPAGVGATADFLQVGGEAPPLPTTPRPEEEVKALLRVRALREENAALRRVWKFW